MSVNKDGMQQHMLTEILHLSLHNQDFKPLEFEGFRGEDVIDAKLMNGVDEDTSK